ncbi:hypothetical protein TNCV_857661 [Trichonephila clavipes]|nr:hypothetical protein TNCV_857661 [Trichonephila clavipes]
MSIPKIESPLEILLQNVLQEKRQNRLDFYGSTEISFVWAVFSWMNVKSPPTQIETKGRKKGSSITTLGKSFSVQIFLITNSLITKISTAILSMTK